MAGMKSWSTVAANNVLANTGFTMDEGQAPSTLNDSIRQAMADIRTEWSQGANIASAATVDLSTATGGYVHITGVVTITSFGTVSAGIRRKITFDGALTLTHNASSLILPTGGNITTVAGDTCEAMSEGSGNWRVLWYAGKNVQANTITATSAVVTPAVGTATATLTLQAAGVTQWTIDNARLAPNLDNTVGIGSASFRVASVFTPIIDTGTTGSGALKTNNGTTVLTWANTGAVGWGTGVANFGTITKRKTADESVTSSTTLQDDDHLTFAIAANEEWVGIVEVSAGASLNTTGIKVTLNAPSGATGEFDAIAFTYTQGVSTGLNRSTSFGSAIDFTTAQLTSGNAKFKLAFWILNGSTPGSVTFQFAQSTNSGTAVTARKGSFMQATRVA